MLPAFRGRAGEREADAVEHRTLAQVRHVVRDVARRVSTTKPAT